MRNFLHIDPPLVYACDFYFVLRLVFFPAHSFCQICLRYYEHEFIELARHSPAVVVCRCSPTQKTQIVRLVRAHTGARVAAVGDGGNDVGMIQAADVGFGLVGKEGRQASLASDFSLYQFRHVARLLLVHGRNCYKNTAALALFVIHRGMCLSCPALLLSITSVERRAVSSKCDRDLNSRDYHYYFYEFVCKALVIRHKKIIRV